MMQSWTWQEGRFVPEEKIALSDRGFRYGMSVFETVAVRQGRPLLLAEHVQSLQSAADHFEITVPVGWEVGMARLTGAFGDVDGVLRIYLTAGPGDLAKPGGAGILALMFEPRAPVSEATYDNGYRVSLQSWHEPRLAGFKTGNYWPRLRILQKARSEQFDEVLLCDSSGELISAAMANLFLVDADGRFSTPPVGAGARPGVIRQWLLSKWPVREMVLGSNELETASGLFLTNSWIGIMPVTRVGERILGIPSVVRDAMAVYAAEVWDGN